MGKKVIVSLVLVCALVFSLASCYGPEIASYTIPIVDLEEGVIRDGGKGKDGVIYTFDDKTINDNSEMFKHKTIVADKNDFGKDYMAHPDSILLKRQGKDGVFEFKDEILTMFPLAHGKGELKGKISYDGGLSYNEVLKHTPASWKKSQETPTLYRLIFNKDNKSDINDKIILISGNPYWPNDKSYKANGFNVSLSSPSVDVNGDIVEGRVWTEFETWYGHGEDDGGSNIIKNPVGKNAYDCIVAMSSLTRLKDPITHEWKNEWMGLFHDHKFDCYKTILSFEGEDHNKMNWSTPEKYFDAYEDIEHQSNMCEVECIRSDAGMGNELVLITRSNSKVMNSLISFSSDEGQTWSQPKETPMALNGERHKAEWVKVNGEDKLFITFRSIDRSTAMRKAFRKNKWMSEGYVAWVGDWNDLKEGTEGDFRVKLAHTYLERQKELSRDAHADTGYAGNVVLPNGKVATCSYGRFSPDKDKDRGKTTYIVGKIIDVEKLYELVDMIK